MTYNGIVRTRSVDIMYEDAKKSQTGSSVSDTLPERLQT